MNNFTIDNYEKLKKISAFIGDPADLVTEDKTIVGAINEISEGGGGGSGPYNVEFLKTVDLGALQTSSTSNTPTGLTVSLTGLTSGNYLYVITYNTNPVNGSLLRTFQSVLLSNGGIVTPTTSNRISYTSSGGIHSQFLKNSIPVTGTYGTSSYNGIYLYGNGDNSVSIDSDGNATYNVYYYYKESLTGTINSTFKMDIYKATFIEE